MNIKDNPYLKKSAVSRRRWAWFFRVALVANLFCVGLVIRTHIINPGFTWRDSLVVLVLAAIWVVVVNLRLIRQVDRYESFPTKGTRPAWMSKIHDQYDK